MSSVATRAILDTEQACVFHRRVRSNSSSAMHCLIADLASTGGTKQAIAKGSEYPEQTVSKWSRRISKRGTAGLRESQRSGRPMRPSTTSINTVLTEAIKPPASRTQCSIRSRPDMSECPIVTFIPSGLAMTAIPTSDEPVNFRGIRTSSQNPGTSSVYADIRPEKPCFRTATRRVSVSPWSGRNPGCRWGWGVSVLRQTNTFYTARSPISRHCRISTARLPARRRPDRRTLNSWVL